MAAQVPLVPGQAVDAELGGSGEFRVETTVYLQGQAAPLLRATTYFTEGAICDITHANQGRNANAAKVANPEFATVLLIDRRGDSAAIVDGKRKVVCSISREEIMRTVAAINANTPTQDKQPLIRFAARPSFDVKWNEAGNLLRMTGEPMQYTVQGQPVGDTDHSRAAGDYREFADWSARTNATVEGGLPPTARLELNNELAAKSCLPTRVEVTRMIVEPNGEQVWKTFYSTHKYHWRLIADDRAEIEKWKARAAGMTGVDLVTLRVNPQIATQKSPKNQLK